MRAFVLLLAAIAVVFAGGCDGKKPSAVSNPQRYVPGDGAVTQFAQGERKPAPRVAGTLLEGGSFDLAHGQVTVINFWASWCAPCRAEAEDLEAVYQATKDRGVQFLGVDIRDGRDDARSFAAGRFSYPSLFDPAGKVALGFRDVPPNTIPATLVLDREGRVAAIARKAVHRQELQVLVDKVLAETHG